MTPELLIDGYNLIFCISDLRAQLQQGLEIARDELLHKLITFRANKKMKITVVFDGSQVGQPNKIKQNGLYLYYSIAPQKADEVIKILIQKSRNPRNFTVISSDNEVAGFARSHGMSTLHAEEFYRKYLVVENKYDSAQTEPNMSKGELQQWLDLFNQNHSS